MGHVHAIPERNALELTFTTTKSKDQNPNFFPQLCGVLIPRGEADALQVQMMDLWVKIIAPPYKFRTHEIECLDRHAKNGGILVHLTAQHGYHEVMYRQ